MKEANPSPNPFDDYLDKIQAREARRRRNQWLLVFAALLLIGGGMGWFYLQGLERTPKAWRTFAFEELDAAQVAQLFADDSSGFLVSIPELGWDTVRSVQQYERLADLVDLIHTARLETSIDTLRVGQDSIHKTPEAQLAGYTVEVKGERRAGQEMIFSIEDYDPAIRYTLDFGNGVRRRVGPVTRYTYPLAGYFTLKLIATSEAQGSSIYTKRYVIADEQARPELADASRQKPARPSQPLSNSAFDLPQFNEPAELTTPRSAEGDTAQRQQVTIVDLGGGSSTAHARLAPPKPSLQEKGPEAPLRIDKPLVYSDVMPEYPGGQSAINRFIHKRIKYPLEALERKVEGRVVVQFVVNADGTLSDIKVVQGIGAGCDEEALRVVRSMGRWKPGEFKGQKVPVYQSIPIVFRLL
ncbi:MAG: TonB family protein [Bacteroidetes bacterium]|nr:MAG: TonB family protein [Bacteroidota bacterium]